MPVPPKSRVLLADVPEMEDLLRSCFREQQVTYVHAFDAAVRSLRTNAFELVVVGLHFDQSSMFALVQFVRSLPRYAQTPIVCIRGMPSVLSAATRNGIRHAVLAAGGNAFVDFGLGPEDVGDLRQRLEHVTHGEPVGLAFDEQHSSLRH